MRGKPVLTPVKKLIEDRQKFQESENNASIAQLCMQILDRNSKWESEKPDILAMIERMQEQVIKQRDYLDLGTGTISQEEYNRRLAMVREETAKVIVKIQPYQRVRWI